MYKGLIKIMILLGALILFSSRAGAASVSLPYGYRLPTGNSGDLLSTSASFAGATIHQLHTVITINSISIQSAGSAFKYSGVTEINPAVAQPAGRLDGIAWNNLDQPSYESVFSQLFVLPSATQLWAHDYAAGTDASTFTDHQSLSHRLLHQADQIQAHPISIIKCSRCHIQSPEPFNAQFRGVE